MKILLASLSNAPDEVFRLHFESVQAQKLPKGITLDYAYISDGLSEASESLVTDAGGQVAAALPKPDDASYSVTETTHEWSEPAFGWMAMEKQRLLELAKEEDYDAIFFVDSDLMLGPDVLESLVYSHKDCVSAVFWTRWMPDQPMLPQVWMRHPYEFDGKGVASHEFLERLNQKDLMRVGGLGACTLIRASVFDRVRWYPLVPGLPTHGMWQGEDRHFCVRAAMGHVELWADAWPDIFHIYRPSYVEAAKRWQAAKPVDRPEVGDWVSLVIEALEEPELMSRRGHVRGRLGNLNVLPEIEKLVSEMYVDQHRVVEVEFPAWWKVASYRGKKKNLLVRLIGAKRYVF